MFNVKTEVRYHEINFSLVYVVVNFLSQIIFIFPLFQPH